MTPWRAAHRRRAVAAARDAGVPGRDADPGRRDVPAWARRFPPGRHRSAVVR